MAKAIVTGIDQAYVESGTPKVQIGVIYAGVDVPGTFQQKGIVVDISGVVNLADLGTTIAASVRTFATASGYTVAASNVFLPNYAAA